MKNLLVVVAYLLVSCGGEIDILGNVDEIIPETQPDTYNEEGWSPQEEQEECPIIVNEEETEDSEVQPNSFIQEDLPDQDTNEEEPADEESSEEEVTREEEIEVPHKIIICHNGRTKLVSRNALWAHVKHGDYEGECDQ